MESVLPGELSLEDGKNQGNASIGPQPSWIQRLVSQLSLLLCLICSRFKVSDINIQLEESLSRAQALICRGWNKTVAAP